MRVCLAGDDNNETASRARKINNGRGFDFVFMAAASARAAELAASLLAPLGALVLAGMPPNEQLARLDTTTIEAKQSLPHFRRFSAQVQHYGMCGLPFG